MVSRSWELYAPEFSYLLVTVGAVLWGRGRWVDPLGDPGFWWSLIARLGEGEVLYRDVYLQYGPLSPYLLALAGRVFGYGSSSLLILTAVPAVVAGLILLYATRGVLTTVERFAVAGLVLGLSIFAPGPGRLVWSYCPAAVLALALSVGALALLRREGRGRNAGAWAAGILAGLAFCSKQEIGLAALIALASPLAVSIHSNLSWFVRCIGGFFVIALMGAAFALWAAPLSVLQARNHLWPFELFPPPEFGTMYRVASGMNSLDWPQTVLSMGVGFLMICAVVALFGAVAARDYRLSRWMPALLFVVVVVVGSLFDPRLLITNFRPYALSMIVAFVSCLLALLDRRVRERSFLIGLSLFAGLIAMRAAFVGKAGDPYTGVAHFATNATWLVFLCLQLPALLPGGEKASAKTRRVWAGVAFAFACWSAATGIRALRSADKVEFLTDRGPVHLDPGRVSFFQKIRVNVTSGESALVLPEINALDVLFGLRSASPFLTHLPGWLDRDTERMLIERFERWGPPDVVVIFTRETSEFGKRSFGNGYGELLSEWISRNYRTAFSTPGGTLLRRIPSQSAGPNDGIVQPGSNGPRGRSRDVSDRCARPAEAGV